MTYLNKHVVPRFGKCLIKHREVDVRDQICVHFFKQARNSRIVIGTQVHLGTVALDELVLHVFEQVCLVVADKLLGQHGLTLVVIQGFKLYLSIICWGTSLNFDGASRGGE